MAEDDHLKLQQSEARAHADLIFEHSDAMPSPHPLLYTGHWQACRGSQSKREAGTVYMQGIQFSVVLTEGRPDETGLSMAKALDDMHVPVIAILDSAVAYALEALRYGSLPSAI